MKKQIVKSVEEGHQVLRDWSATFPGLPAYGVLLNHEGVLTVELRHGRPCYGELRKYGKRSTRPFDSKPGDLPTPLGPGSPLAVALRVRTPDPLILTALASPEGPYRTLHKDTEVLSSGFLIKDTTFDPTLMVHMMKFADYVQPKLLLKLLAVYHPAVALLLSKYCDHWGTINFGDDYSFSKYTSVRRFLTGDSLNLTNGTWLDGEDYNRPCLAACFCHLSEEHLTLARTTTTQPAQWLVRDRQADAGWDVLIELFTRLFMDPHPRYNLDKPKEVENALFDWCRP